MGNEIGHSVLLTSSIYFKHPLNFTSWMWLECKKYESKELMILYFEFRSDKKTTKCKLKHEQYFIVKISIEPKKGGNITLYLRMSFVVQRRSGLGESTTPSPLWSKPVVPRRVVCWWLPLSLLDPSPAPPMPKVMVEWLKSSDWQSLAENMSPSFYSITAIYGSGVSFRVASQEAQSLLLDSGFTWPVTLVG